MVLSILDYQINETAVKRGYYSLVDKFRDTRFWTYAIKKNTSEGINCFTKGCLTICVKPQSPHTCHGLTPPRSVGAGECRGRFKSFFSKNSVLSVAQNIFYSPICYSLLPRQTIEIQDSIYRSLFFDIQDHRAVGGKFDLALGLFDKHLSFERFPVEALIKFHQV